MNTPNILDIVYVIQKEFNLKCTLILKIQLKTMIAKLKTEFPQCSPSIF